MITIRSDARTFPSIFASLRSRITWAVALVSLAFSAYAGTVLQTSGGAESLLQGLTGKSTGVTVTGPQAAGGPCVYSGHGSFLVDDSGHLLIQAQQTCGALTNLGTLAVCTLSADLECTATGRFEHHYEVSGAGLGVDSRVIPWTPSNAPSVPGLLQALQGRIRSGAALSAAQRSAPNPLPGGLVVRCHAPRSNFMIRGGLSALMRYQQRPDPEGVCADPVLQQFLATAREGDPVGPDSALGRCFTLAGKVTDWGTTSCAAATH
jgi:hypothetical protein